MMYVPWTCCQLPESSQMYADSAAFCCVVNPIQCPDVYARRDKYSHCVSALRLSKQDYVFSINGYHNQPHSQALQCMYLEKIPTRTPTSFSHIRAGINDTILPHRNSSYLCTGSIRSSKSSWGMHSVQQHYWYQHRWAC
jgi:hypothetical protein